MRDAQLSHLDEAIEALDRSEQCARDFWAAVDAMNRCDEDMGSGIIVETAILERGAP